MLSSETEDSTERDKTLIRAGRSILQNKFVSYFFSVCAIYKRAGWACVISVTLCGSASLQKLSLPHRLPFTSVHQRASVASALPWGNANQYHFHFNYNSFQIRNYVCFSCVWTTRLKLIYIGTKLAPSQKADRGWNILRKFDRKIIYYLLGYEIN